MVSLPPDYRGRDEVPYTLLVQSRSQLKMRCRIGQDSHLPDSVMTLNVDLTEMGAPLRSPAAMVVQVTDPGGKTRQLDQVSGESGELLFSYPGKDPGIYHWLIRATGASNAGTPYQRECRLTGAIWTSDTEVGRELESLGEDGIQK